MRSVLLHSVVGTQRAWALSGLLVTAGMLLLVLSPLLARTARADVVSCNPYTPCPTGYCCCDNFECVPEYNADEIP